MSQTLEPVLITHPCLLTQDDFDRFAALSGDRNPIHVDPVFAARTPFGAPVSHGMLLFTRLRGLIEQHYPGRVLTQQSLMFPAPSYAGEFLTLRLVPDSDPGTRGVVLRTEVLKPDGRLGVQGRCVLGGNLVPATPRPEPADTPAGPAPDLDRFLRLKVGDTARLARRFDRADVAAWAALACLTTPPATLPEPLIAALFSCLLGEELPGHGTNYLKQSMQFLHPARIGETLSATVTITRLRADKALVDLQTQCHGEDGRLLCDGSALVLFRQ